MVGIVLFSVTITGNWWENGGDILFIFLFFGWGAISLTAAFVKQQLCNTHIDNTPEYYRWSQTITAVHPQTC